MDEILDYLKTKMTVDEIGGNLQVTRVIGTLNPPIARSIEDIKNYFVSTEYTPLFEIINNRHVIKFGIFKKAEHKPKYWLNLVLFLATIGSTIFAGYLNSGSVVQGVIFSFSIMAILTCHELGHYIVSRRAGMITTLPYFIPVPFHFIGTFGAVIRMKSIVPSRPSLLRVGMAGPLAGFIIALPITFIGIALSGVQPSPEGMEGLRLGNSLLFYIMVEVIHPNIPPGYDLFLHPMAFAGWLGFLVTSMNLIPVGQLDGGHISYSIFLKKRKYSYIFIFGVLVGLGFLWPGWFIWGLLIYFLARRDPVVQDSITPLSPKEIRYAVITLIVLLLTFIPQPFAIW